MNKNIHFLSILLTICFLNVTTWGGNNLPTVMMTGYWDPSGMMLVPFCTDTSLNPTGWIGEDWEGYGYNVYAFFPEPGTYTGIFEVDYQDTWEDFWMITDSLHPQAIISYGVGPVATGFRWEFEYNARNLDADDWSPDGTPPLKPTPCPPDSTSPVDFIRHPTLPLDNIVNALNTGTPIKATIDYNGTANNFLCEYLAFLGMWYQELHASPDDSFPCMASGYIHILKGDPVSELTNAVCVTLREVIKSLISTQGAEPIQTCRSGLSLNFSQNRHNPSLVISFHLSRTQNISLILFDSKGKIVQHLINGFGTSGENKITFNTQNLPSSIYFFRLVTSDAGKVSRKIVVCR